MWTVAHFEDGKPSLNNCFDGLLLLRDDALRSANNLNRWRALQRFTHSQIIYIAVPLPLIREG